MRDHWRTLGQLFVAWALAQLATAVVLTVWRPGQLAEAPAPGAALLLLTGVTSAAYLWTGRGLRRHEPRMRIAALVLSALALLSFPVGTAVGAYGLWVLLKRAPVPGGGGPLPGAQV